MKIATAERAQYLESYEKEKSTRHDLEGNSNWTKNRYSYVNLSAFFLVRVMQLDAELKEQSDTHLAMQKDFHQTNAKLEALSEYLKEKEGLLQR